MPRKLIGLYKTEGLKKKDISKFAKLVYEDIRKRIEEIKKEEAKESGKNK